MGFPNVRAARRAEELTALAERYEEAARSAEAGGYQDALVKFRRAMAFSRAVICRSVSKAKELVSNDNELYASFYELVGVGARRPEATQVEYDRLIADDLLFPYYRSEIRFAALSLDGNGVTAYGTCSMVLRDVAIESRATAFEENSVTFCLIRGLGFGKPVPPGYRAAWELRDLLACAKLHKALEDHPHEGSFPQILMSSQDFIEVHIYGKLHRGSIESIRVSRPLLGPDEVLLAEIERTIADGQIAITIEKP